MKRTEVNAPESMTPRARSRPDAALRVDASASDLTVGAVASLVGVSVRTLHHWDDIGLVHPSDRTPAGYRAYAAGDVERIHRVLVYQELGLSLTRIAALLDDPTVDEAQQLRNQRRLLDERIARLREMADAVDRVLAARSDGTTLTAREQAEIFGRGWREDWAEEARERWGASEQWAQFEQAAGGLSASDRDELRRSGELLHVELAAAKRSGIVAGSPAANLLAERHRAMIGRLYDCTHSMHVCLARLYVADHRFSSHLDDLDADLSTWLHDVICANAMVHGVDPDTAVWQ